MFRIEATSNPQTAYAAPADGLYLFGVEPDSGADFAFSRVRSSVPSAVATGAGTFSLVLLAGDTLVVDGGSDGNLYGVRLGDEL